MINGAWPPYHNGFSARGVSDTIGTIIEAELVRLIQQVGRECNSVIVTQDGVNLALRFLVLKMMYFMITVRVVIGEIPAGPAMDWIVHIYAPYVDDDG